MAEKYGQSTLPIPPGATQLTLVRHGQSQAADADEPFPLVDGHGDPPLTDLGHRQAAAVGERLADRTFDAMYVTTLTRTHQTAAPLAERLAMTPDVEPDLREVFMGDWEGGLFRQMAAEGHPAILAMREQQDWGAIPGAETNAEFWGRTVAAAQGLHERHPDQQVIAFVHGGVVTSLCRHAADADPFAFSGADNASISHIVISDQGWKLRSFNDCAHLDGLISGLDG